MDTSSLLIFFCLLSTLLFSLCWWVARTIDNYSIVDVLWSYTFGLFALICALYGSGAPNKKIWIGILFFLWSFRLGTYLAKRVFSHISQEDGRYIELRKEYGNSVAFRFYLFYLFQAASAVTLSLPLLLSAQNLDAETHPFEVFGTFLWIIGMLGESFSDYQLSKFKKSPSNKGKVCDVGLWKYSRHPNYFFEAVIWFGYGVFSAGTGGAEWAWLSVVTMWILLRFVTGVPYSEKQNLKSKPVEYQQYQRITSIFFPLPPRRN